MKRRLVITLGRQFGSGGRSIGKRLAEELGIEYYDKELIKLAAKESGIADSFFEKADEKGGVSSLFSAFSLGGVGIGGTMFFQSNDYLSSESLFKIQSDVIRKVAADRSCVIVGRCADYILRGDPDCISIFICGDERDRLRRIMKYSGITKVAEARSQMRKADKTRAEYYNYYTDKTWGSSDSYDFCINSSTFGEEQTYQIIKSICMEIMNKDK